MNKCHPVEMRKNLEIVDNLRKAGIDFVCIPVNNDKDKLIRQQQEAFDLIIKGES